MEWIKIQERKPEFEKPVWVCHEGSEETVAICRLNSFRTSKQGEALDWVEGRNGHDDWYHEVTHWAFIVSATN